MVMFQLFKIQLGGIQPLTDMSLSIYVFMNTILLVYEILSTLFLRYLWFTLSSTRRGPLLFHTSYDDFTWLVVRPETSFLTYLLYFFHFDKVVLLYYTRFSSTIPSWTIQITRGFSSHTGVNQEVGEPTITWNSMWLVVETRSVT